MNNDIPFLAQNPFSVCNSDSLVGVAYWSYYPKQIELKLFTTFSIDGTQYHTCFIITYIIILKNLKTYLNFLYSNLKPDPFIILSDFNSISNTNWRPKWPTVLIKTPRWYTVANYKTKRHRVQFSSQNLCVPYSRAMHLLSVSPGRGPIKFNSRPRIEAAKWAIGCVPIWDMWIG